MKTKNLLYLLCLLALLFIGCSGSDSAGHDSKDKPPISIPTTPSPLPTQDQDSDGIADLADNCPTIANVSQADFDGNAIGDVCDNHCSTSLSTVKPYSCKISGLGEGTQFSLVNQPEGMVIQPRSGQLNWTPAAHQQGTYPVLITREHNNELHQTNVEFVVSASGQTMPVAWYVSPFGNDDNTGSADAPLLSLVEAGRRVQPGETIYLRGGDYFNDGYGTAFEGRRSNIARFTTQASAEQPIKIRQWGNEYPRLISDVNGLSLANARHWIIEGLELMGTNHQLSREDSLANWWNTTEGSNQITGRGIALNSSFYITIRNCVIHDFSGAGISNNYGAHLLLENNLIYNNVWWSTAGSHGVANSKPKTDDNFDPASFKIIMRGNMLFANQSLMISHVFSKGFVTLAIDEGNGMHMQNNAGQFFGRFLAEHNLAFLNGKAGLGLNTVDGSVIRRNSFWHNARSVASSAELSIQSSNSDDISHNLLHASPNRGTIKDFQGAFAGVGENYAVAGNDATNLPESTKQVPSLFVAPSAFNFQPVSSIPSGFGVPTNDLVRMKEKLQEFGIQPAEAPTLVTPEYIQQLRQAIFNSWPAPVAGDGIPDDLTLLDPETGFCYRYQDRMTYPNDPKNQADCGK